MNYKEVRECAREYESGNSKEQAFGEGMLRTLEYLGKENKKIVEKEIKRIEEFSKENYDKDEQYSDVMNWQLQDTDDPIFDAGQLCALKNLLYEFKKLK